MQPLGGPNLEQGPSKAIGRFALPKLPRKTKGDAMSNRLKCKDCHHPAIIQAGGLNGPVVLHDTKDGRKVKCPCGCRKAIL